MEIRDRKTVQGVTGVRATTGSSAKPAAQAATAPSDVVEVAGITEAELTPNVRRALTALMAEVEQLRRKLDETHARISHLEKLVDEDPLMPVANRRAFVRELTRMMAFSQRYNVPASVVYFDINDMKHINDTYGHGAGDAVLVAVAKVLVENVRTTDIVARLGGDEMGVLLVQTDETVAEHKAKELATLIRENQVPYEGHMLSVGVAYGVHGLAQGDTNAGAVLDAADRAMYEEKSRMKSAT